MGTCRLSSILCILLLIEYSIYSFIPCSNHRHVLAYNRLDISVYGYRGRKTNTNTTTTTTTIPIDNLLLYNTTTANTLSSSLRDASPIPLLSLQKEASSNDIVMHLKDVMNARKSMTRDEFLSIVSLVSNHLLIDADSRLSNSWISDTLFSLGTIKVISPSLNLYSDEEVVAISNHLLVGMTSKDVRPLHVTKSLLGLARLNIKIAMLSKEALVSLMDIIGNKVVASMNSQGLSNLCWSLGTLNVKYRNLPGSVKTLLISQILQVSASMNDQSISNILWGLQLMEASWVEDIPLAVQSSLSSSICRVCTKMSPQAIGNTLYAMGKIGVTYRSMTDRLLIAVEVAIRKAASRMVKLDAMQVLQGLVLLDYDWKYLSLQSQESLSMALYKQAKSWTKTGPRSSIEIATVFYSLMKLGIQWSSVNAQLRAALLIGLQEICNFTHYDDTEKSEYGAISRSNRVKLKASATNRIRRVTSDIPRIHDETTSIAKHSVYDALALSNSNELDTSDRVGGILARALATTMYAASQYELLFQALPMPVQSKVLVGIGKYASNLSTQGLCMILQAMATMGLVWKDTLSVHAQTALLNSVIAAFHTYQYRSKDTTVLTLQGFTLMLCSLGTMGVHWRHLPITFQQQSMQLLQRQVLPDIDIADLASVLHALTRVHVKWSDLPHEVSEDIANVFTSYESTVSQEDKAVFIPLCLYNFARLHCNRFVIGTVGTERLGLELLESVPEMPIESILQTLRGMGSSSGSRIGNTDAVRIKVSRKLFSSILYDHKQSVSSPTTAAIIVSSLGNSPIMHRQDADVATFTAKLLHALPTAVTGMSTRELLLMLIGLCGMRVKYSDLTSDLKDSIASALLVSKPTTMDDVTALVHALSRLRYKLSSAAEGGAMAVACQGIADAVIRSVSDGEHMTCGRAQSLLASLMNINAFHANTGIDGRLYLPASVEVSVMMTAFGNQRSIRSIIDGLSRLNAIGVNCVGSFASSSSLKVLLLGICEAIVNDVEVQQAGPTAAVQALDLLVRMRQLSCDWSMLPPMGQSVIISMTIKLLGSPSTDVNDAIALFAAMTELGCDWQKLHALSIATADRVVILTSEALTNDRSISRSKSKKLLTAWSSFNIHWDQLR